MSHLLAISVGPVQEFIAAARRTRDLWFGSLLLSEISRAVAESVQGQGGRLIFPASLDAKNVANVILTELDAGDPKDVAAIAKKAARSRWRDFADETRSKASDVIRLDIWNDQVDDVIEFYASWVLRSDDYERDRARVMRLMDGRKNCKDFLPALGYAGVPKSSLDGQRESVLRSPADWPSRFRPRLRIRDGEQLDVVGLVKRIAEGTRPYPSVARVAADPWVRGNETRLTEVISACERLGDQVIRPLNTDRFPRFAAFPFEGTAVYLSRHHELNQETKATADDLRTLRDSLARLPQPEPYLAVLVADGDKVGKAISQFNSPDDHREFSQALAGFGIEAQTIVDKHNGVLVYTGGDDVLAFLPVDKCLGCARKLHDKFAEVLRKYESLTLSIGLALGHFMENLEDLLQYGRAAEKAAKQPDRDGLAVHLHKRGSSPVKVRARWTENSPPDERIIGYANQIRDDVIPSKLPYDLRKLADLYDHWPPDTAADALRQDVLRVIRAKQPRLGRGYLQRIEDALRASVTDARSLRRFAEELLIARQIATSSRQVGKSPAPAGEVAV